MGRILGDKRMLQLLLAGYIIFLKCVSGATTKCSERTSDSGDKYCWAEDCPTNKMIDTTRCLKNQDHWGRCNALRQDLVAGCEDRTSASGGNTCLPEGAGEVFAVSQDDRDELSECFNAFAQGKSSFEPNSRCWQLTLQQWASFGCNCEEDVKETMQLSTEYCGNVDVCGSVTSIPCPGSDFGEDFPDLPNTAVDDTAENVPTDADEPTNTDVPTAPTVPATTTADGKESEVTGGTSVTEKGDAGEGEKPWYKKEWIWAIIAVVATILVATPCWRYFCGGGGDKPSTPRTPRNQTINVNQTNGNASWTSSN